MGVSDVGGELTVLMGLMAVFAYIEGRPSKGETGSGGEGKDLESGESGGSGGFTNNPQSFLRRALRNQGMDTPPNQFKETWIEGEYKYTVRIHERNTKYTVASSIYRVSRQSINLDVC